jgi:hypothetical protein
MLPSPPFLRPHHRLLVPPVRLHTHIDRDIDAPLLGQLFGNVCSLLLQRGSRLCQFAADLGELIAELGELGGELEEVVDGGHCGLVVCGGLGVGSLGVGELKWLMVVAGWLNWCSRFSVEEYGCWYSMVARDSLVRKWYRTRRGRGYRSKRRKGLYVLLPRACIHIWLLSMQCICTSMCMRTRRGTRPCQVNGTLQCLQHIAFSILLLYVQCASHTQKTTQCDARDALDSHCYINLAAQDAPLLFDRTKCPTRPHQNLLHSHHQYRLIPAASQTSSSTWSKNTSTHT